MPSLSITNPIQTAFLRTVAIELQQLDRAIEQARAAREKRDAEARKLIAEEVGVEIPEGAKIVLAEKGLAYEWPDQSEPREVTAADVQPLHERAPRRRKK